MHALIQDGTIARYPYTLADLKRDNPDLLFPLTVSDDELAQHRVVRVFNATQPTLTLTQALDELTPAFNTETNRWEQVWSVRDKTPEELDSAKQLLVTTVTQATQQRLDDFARTRNYDGILSACTYATSTVAKFAAEGQYCVEARDATWAKLYAIMAEVETGTRPLPAGFSDVEPDLPVLAWPV